MFSQTNRMKCGGRRRADAETRRQQDESESWTDRPTGNLQNDRISGEDIEEYGG